MRQNKRGMDVGLRIWITHSVLPFFAEDGPLAAWIAETCDFTRNTGRTGMSYNNGSSKSLTLSSLFLAQNQREFVP